MNDTPNTSTNTNMSAVTLPTPETDSPALIKKIGRTTYEVSYHFSTTSKETMSDKIKRLIKRDMDT